MNQESLAGGNALRVAFVCPTAAPFFDRQQPGYTGGMEKRAWLFASGLARGTPIAWVQRMADDTSAAVDLRLLPPRPVQV